MLDSYQGIALAMPELPHNQQCLQAPLGAAITV